MSHTYVHGYSPEEAARLNCQASILAQFIHAKATFPPGTRILEAGCGIGAQTIQLAQNNPHSQIISVDRSADSLRMAKERSSSCGLVNVEFQLADISELPYLDGEFDGVFVCFLLEHLTSHERGLREIRRVLRPGAMVRVFEGDHGSVLAWPNAPSIGRLVAAVSRYQILQGGDPDIGRRLFPILDGAGFEKVEVEPCIAYADDSRPNWVDGFTRSTFIEMMKGQRDPILACDLLNESEWHEGMTALDRTTRGGGSFCYTFFRAVAQR